MTENNAPDVYTCAWKRYLTRLQLHLSPEKLNAAAIIGPQRLRERYTSVLENYFPDRSTEGGIVRRYVIIYNDQTHGGVLKSRNSDVLRRSNDTEKLWPREIGTLRESRTRKIGKAANGEKIEPGTSRELSGPIRSENTANMC